MYEDAIVRFVGAVVSVHDGEIYLEFGNTGINVEDADGVGIKSHEGEMIDCTGQVKTKETETEDAVYTNYYIEIQKIG